MSETKRKRTQPLLGTALVLFLIGGTIVWLIGGALCAPFPRKVFPPTKLPVEPVVITSKSGSQLQGWLINGKENRGVIILMHGVRGCRADMVGRARFLANAGYTVLLFDFQAHGESQGKHITFGYLESRDASAAVDFAKNRFPSKRIAVIGGSLGGAAALLAVPPLDVQAIILESVYPTIEKAVEDRLEIKFGILGRQFAPLLVCQLKPRLGCGVDDLCPIRSAATNKVPKLFIAGTKDRHTKIEEAREMFRRSAEPKQFWELEGAGHVDLHQFARETYEQRLLSFLSHHLNEN